MGTEEKRRNRKKENMKEACLMEPTFHPPCSPQRNVSPDTHILLFLSPGLLFSYSFPFLATYLKTCVVPSLHSYLSALSSSPCTLPFLRGILNNTLHAPPSQHDNNPSRDYVLFSSPAFFILCSLLLFVSTRASAAFIV
jgi:hypothetical protein